MFVKNVLVQVFNGDTTSQEAVKMLAQGMTREQLAEFVVEAFKRGWIDRFNLGITDDGELWCK